MRERRVVRGTEGGEGMKEEGGRRREGGGW